MRQVSTKVAHPTFLQNQGDLNRVSQFSTFFYGDFSVNEHNKAAHGFKSHLSTQRTGFPDPTKCPQQLHVCNCRNNYSAKTSLGLEYCINSTQKYKTWPHCNICNIKASSDLGILNYTQSISLLLFFLKQMAIRRHESAFMCLPGYKAVLQNPIYTRRGTAE